MSFLQRILQKLRMLLTQENPNELDIYIYCDCQRVAGDENGGNIGVPHLVLDLSDFGCIAMRAKSEDYLQEMVRETNTILREQLFVPQLSYACPYKKCIERNLAARNLLPAPVPAAED